MNSLRKLFVVPIEAEAAGARDCLVVLFNSLAQAVTYGIPFARRLRDLERDRSNASFYPWGFLYTGKIRRETWHSLMKELIQSLEEGNSLGHALDTHLGDILPDHVVPAILGAEQNGRLREVLPIVVESLQDRATVQNSWQSAMIYPLLQFMVLYTVLSGLFVFIVPKFAKMFDEMLPGEPLPNLTRFVIEASNLLQSGFGILLLFLGLVMLLSILRFFGDRVLRWAPWSEEALWIGSAAIVVAIACSPGLLKPLIPWLTQMLVLIIIARVLRFVRKPSRSRWRQFCRQLSARMKACIPFVSKMQRNRETMYLCHAMAALISAGLDIPEAAQIAIAECSLPGTRRQLEQFCQLLDKGLVWPEAWEKTVARDPLQLWILRNAASRQDPADGFASAAFLLSQRMERARRAIPKWSETCGIVINAVVLGIVVIGLFLPLIKLVSALSG